MRFMSGPESLWLVRHGQSQGNVARERANINGLETIEMPTRDADVELSDAGIAQATALGRWLALQPAGELPTVILSSPYRRAMETARLMQEYAGAPLQSLTIDVDDRLRDRELGILDGLTWKGTQARYPIEAERAVRVGRYFYRPPGGESWADMSLRIRSVLADVAREWAGERVLLVCHDVPIQLIRVIIEGLSEQQAIEMITGRLYANCGLTRFESTADGYEIRDYNYTVPVEQSPAPVTSDADVQAGPR